MITLNNINLSSIDLSGIDLRGIKLGLEGRGGGSGDGFPVLPGDVTRWHFGGLTNEMMAAMDDPRIEDADGKGRFLSFKNFAWKGMSGVGGYGDENYHTFYKFTLDDYVFMASPPGVEHMNFTFRVTGLQPGNKLTLAFFGTTQTVYGTWDKDGIYTVDADIVEAGKPTYFYNGYGATGGEFTIEILPLYPGALVFDGVDDYGICENFPILTKEKGYTVVALRQWITIPNDNLFYGLMTNGNSRTDGAFVFEDFNRDSKSSFSFGAYTTVESGTLSMPFTYQTSTSYNGKAINIGSLEKGVDIFYVGRMGSRSYYVNAAIWEICILDHDATEEELQKIQDYYKKEYSWLFPDQAWTVTGKTNEGTDRATIANITGNGNNLVLRNFGFAENSGYGLYGTNYTTWTNPGRATYTVSSDKIHITKVSSVPQSDFIYVNGLTKLIQKIKVTGLPQGVKLRIGRTELWTHEIATDGIYNIKVTDSSDSPLIGYNIDTLLDSCDITIEQIPDYEGYLVTDGVDDKIVSAKPITFAEKWTVVTDTIFLGAKVVSAGILVQKIFSINDYLEYGRVEVNVWNGARSKIPTSSIKAISSDGKIYDADWNEYQAEPGTIEISNGYLVIATSHSRIQYCQIAFKNLGIYNNQILTKEDCIKAYNYLQTLKAK